MKRVWVLAGTSEGREVCSLLRARGVPFLATVATEYGASLIDRDAAQDAPEIRIGGLNEEQMRELISREGIAAAIDATHPYAAQASANAQAACAACSIPYLREGRAQTAGAEAEDGVVRVRSVGEAASYLNEHEGNALIATGGNGAAAYTAVRDFQNRLLLRILPDSRVLAKCEALGYSARNIAAMQGPFSEELNVSMLRSIGARYLVTKDSGAVGGTAEKLAAAKKAGATVILVTRPAGEADDQASTPEQAADWAQKILGVQTAEESGKEPERAEQPPRREGEGKLFPLFIGIAGKPALVAGGGAVGARRAEVLASFGARVRIVAPELCGEAKALIESGAAEWINRRFEAGDCARCTLVVAATNERAANAQIAREAKALGIPVSVADAPDEATFHFPAIVRQGGAVLGITTGDPAKTKALAAKLREVFKELF